MCYTTEKMWRRECHNYRAKQRNSSRTDSCPKNVFLQLFVDSDEDRHVQGNSNKAGEQTFEEVTDTLVAGYLNHQGYWSSRTTTYNIEGGKSNVFSGF